jgi:hypothetical protein
LIWLHSTDIEYADWFTPEQEMDAFLALIGLPETSPTWSFAFASEYKGVIPEGAWKAVAYVKKPFHGASTHPDNQWLTVVLAFKEKDDNWIRNGTWASVHLHQNGYESVNLWRKQLHEDHYPGGSMVTRPVSCSAH